MIGIWDLKLAGVRRSLNPAGNTQTPNHNSQPKFKSQFLKTHVGICDLFGTWGLGFGIYQVVPINYRLVTNLVTPSAGIKEDLTYKIFSSSLSEIWIKQQWFLLKFNLAFFTMMGQE